MPALNKLSAEAGLEETKMILGWFFDFRCLLVSFPENKFLAWKEDVERLIATGFSMAKGLESLVGQKTHSSVIVPSVHNFLNRLRDLQTKAKIRRKIRIDTRCTDDLKLMLFFLERAHRGIYVNIVSYLLSTICYHSDSCPKGLRGYSDKGWAWRWYHTEDLLFGH